MMYYTELNRTIPYCEWTVKNSSLPRQNQVLFYYTLKPSPGFFGTLFKARKWVGSILEKNLLFWGFYHAKMEISQYIHSRVLFGSVEYSKYSSKWALNRQRRSKWT